MTDTAGSPVDPHHVWLGLHVIKEGIPATIKAIDQWVLWKAQKRQPPRVGVDKVPYQVSGVHARPGDPRTWTDFRTVIAALDEAPPNTYAGVGLNVKSENGILVLDWDHVRDGTNGVIDPEILEQVRWLGSYAEVSPSGTGIRVVGYGSLSHAITSTTLQGWADGRFVTITGWHIEGTPTDLQPIDPLRLAALIDHFCPKRAAFGSAAPSGPLLDERRVLELRHALGHIPPDDYQVWVTVGMALQSTGAGNAFGLWNEWSVGSAKYPGVGETRKKWASFTDRPGGIEIETVFALAAQHGWVNPATRAAQAFEREVGVSIEEANRLQPAPVVFAPEVERVLPFPVGGLNEVCRWIEAGAAVSYPVVTQHAALCLAATAAARRYVTPMGDPLSLYLGASGQSIGDLRYAHTAMLRALTDAGLRRMVRATRFTSPQTIYRTLMRSPASIYLSDDYGGLSAFAKRQPSGLQEQALVVLAQVFEGGPIQLDNPEDAGLKAGSVGDEQPVIQCPALSMFALVGADHLATLLRASELGRGALGQLLLVIADDDQAEQRDPAPTDAPAWLAFHLRTLRGVVAQATNAQVDLSTINDGNAENLPHQCVVPFAADLAPAYAALDAVSKDRRIRSLLSDARRHVRRVAAVLAAWQDPVRPVVDKPLVDWAGEYVRARLAAMVEQFGVLHGSDGKPAVYDQILLRLHEAKEEGLSRGALAQVCWGFKVMSAKARGELIEQMLGDEVIFDVSVKGHRGAPKKRLVAEKFVKKDEAEA